MFRYLLIFLSISLMAGCSLYSSDGRKKFEKDFANPSLSLLGCQLVTDPEMAELLKSSEENIITQTTDATDTVVQLSLKDEFVQECYYKNHSEEGNNE